MSAKVNINRRIMPLTERQNLEKQIKLEEGEERGEIPEVSREMSKHLVQGAAAKEDSPFNVRGGVNAPQTQRAKKLLEQGQPDSLNEHEKIALLKEKKRLEDWIRGNMVTRRMMNLRPSIGGSTNPEFRVAVNKVAKLEHSPEFTRNALRLKNILRQLDPENPMAGSIEYLRPK